MAIFDWNYYKYEYNKIYAFKLFSVKDYQSINVFVHKIGKFIKKQAFYLLEEESKSKGRGKQIIDFCKNIYFGCEKKENPQINRTKNYLTVLILAIRSFMIVWFLNSVNFICNMCKQYRLLI